VPDSRNRRRRGRSRKRRPAASGAPALPGNDPSSATGLPGARREPSSARKTASGGREPASGSERARGERSARPPGAGERPRPPWYPLPLSELLILAGAIGTVVGLRRGVSNGGPVLFAGLAAVIIGTIEVTLREHLGGYRSHALILALLPTIVFHSAIALGVAAFTRVPGWLNVVLVVLDVALFAFLYKLLRARYLDARRERTFARRR
jgi:hypothetical protein